MIHVLFFWFSYYAICTWNTYIEMRTCLLMVWKPKQVWKSFWKQYSSHFPCQIPPFIPGSIFILQDWDWERIPLLILPNGLSVGLIVYQSYQLLQLWHFSNPKMSWLIYFFPFLNVIFCKCLEANPEAIQFLGNRTSSYCLDHTNLISNQKLCEIIQKEDKVWDHWHENNTFYTITE